MNRIKHIIESSESFEGRVFDLFIQICIIVSLISFAFDTLPGLSAESQALLQKIEVASISIFTAEYILRVLVARPTSSYLLSFFGIVDFLAIAPFWIGLGVDLRSVRAFRMLRLFRVFKLARYNAAVRRFHSALQIAREEIILFLSAAGILIYLASVGIYYFESDAQPDKFGSVFHCLWWAIATLTTVGYGDVYPVTVGGKAFTFALLLVGLGVI
ncbi:MAG: hypothetical protein RLZZ303_3439, partial [Candidatus Hydrogenedentota bacterium]